MTFQNNLPPIFLGVNYFFILKDNFKFGLAVAGTLQGVPQVRGNANCMPSSKVQRTQDEYSLTIKIVTDEKNGIKTNGGSYC